MPETTIEEIATQRHHMTDAATDGWDLPATGEQIRYLAALLPMGAEVTWLFYGALTIGAGSALIGTLVEQRGAARLAGLQDAV
jgi:hypothetical protein